MRKAVVTGGNGFVGSNLVQSLTSMGVEVHAVANENEARLRDLLPSSQIHLLRGSPYLASDLILELTPDAIFHLAAVYEEPSTIERIACMVDGNFALGAALLFGASQCSTPAIFVNTGTYWQYAEDGTYAPNSVYAATKQAFQDLLSFYESRGAVSATTLVLYDTFGPDDTRSKLWSQLLALPPGSTLELSEGKQLIELVAIEDVIRAFLRAAELLESGSKLEPVYGVRSTSPVTLREMVTAFDARCSLGLQLEWGAKPYWAGQILQPWCAGLLPGWEPEINVVDRLVEMRTEMAQTEVAHDGNG